MVNPKFDCDCYANLNHIFFEIDFNLEMHCLMDCLLYISDRQDANAFSILFGAEVIVVR